MLIHGIREGKMSVSPDRPGTKLLYFSQFQPGYMGKWLKVSPFLNKSGIVAVKRYTL